MTSLVSDLENPVRIQPDPPAPVLAEAEPA
jgi:hypothetical protein